MSFWSLLKVIKQNNLAANAPKPLRTKTPMRLSQDSAMSISITPMILAEAAGAMFKSDLPTDEKVFAVGSISLFGQNFYHSYLSQVEGAFIQICSHNDKVVDMRLFRPLDEVIPASEDDWEFWLENEDGNIGRPSIQTKDGTIFDRAWGGGDQRISPFILDESVLDVSGANSIVKHRMMLYKRPLTDPKLTEYLLVSAVQTHNEASVNLWLGIDLAASDLTVYAASDAPL